MSYLEILKVILPIFTALLVGAYCKKLIFPVISTCLIRIICCTVSLIIGCLIIFNFMPFDKKVLVVVMVVFTLILFVFISIYALNGENV